MPPPPPARSFILLSLLLFLAITITITASATQTSHPRIRRVLPASLPPPPPTRPPHHHHHHTMPPRPPLTPPPHLPPPPPLPVPNPTTPATPTPVAVPPAQAPPPTPTATPPTPKYPSSSANPSSDPYPFTNYPFFPAATSPPPPPAPTEPSSSSGDGGLPTFPANISNLVAPTPRASASHRFPVLQALLLSLLSLCLILLSAVLSIHLFRRLRHRGRSGAAAASSSAAHRRAANDDDDDGDEEGRRLKPPPMPTSSSNPSTEFLYLGTLATPPPAPQPPGTSSHLRPGSPELRPLPPLPRVGPPSGEFASRSSASDPSTMPPAAADASSSSLSPSSPSASSPTLGSSPVHLRPPSIPQPRGRAPNPSPPKRRPSPPKVVAEPMAAHAWNPFVAVPPGAVASDEGDSDEKSIRKSRPLHSDKLKPGSLHMKDEVIQLYLNNSAAVAAPREVCLLGAPRCHGIGMVVGALGVSKEQVRDALLEGNAHGLGVEALRMLTQIVVTSEEELKLKYFKDDSLSKLCPVEAFLKTMLDVPFAFKRVDAMLYIASFYLEVNQLRTSYATLEAACQEMRSSRLFHKVLEAVLNFGNFMSINAGSPNSQGLEPNTLLKIVDVKGADGKAALLQFVVQEIVKPEGFSMMHPGSATCKMNDAECRKHGLEVVSKLAAELSNTKKASSVDIMRLSRTVSELGVGLGKVHDVLRLNSMVTSAESSRRFHNTMSMFLRQAEEEILKLQSQESICLSWVKEMADYFHGDSGNDEAHMLRIFAGVKEFLAMLDRICKEACP
ncbi:formin-like protein 14 [Phragmites australis]|uniref:formin-like protein 14 n=1 Tax=Phragmites australis TaxID=29695 RepID=UPI002D76A6A0|nr:formin-like protein 14 [Phragmites australis]